MYLSYNFSLTTNSLLITTFTLTKETKTKMFVTHLSFSTGWPSAKAKNTTCAPSNSVHNLAIFVSPYLCLQSGYSFIIRRQFCFIDLHYWSKLSMFSYRLSNVFLLMFYPFFLLSDFMSFFMLVKLMLCFLYMGYVAILFPNLFSIFETYLYLFLLFNIFHKRILNFVWKNYSPFTS